MTGPAQVTWCPLCLRGEYCPDNERLMKQNTEINADLLAALIAIVKVIDRAPDRECPAAALEMARAAIKRAEGRSK